MVTVLVTLPVVDAGTVKVIAFVTLPPRNDRSQGAGEAGTAADVGATGGEAATGRALSATYP
jgi:hypothetical protein